MDKIVVGCDDCERDLRTQPTIHLAIKPNYGPQALPVLVIRSERGVMRIPLSPNHRRRLQAWGVPTSGKEKP